MVSSGELAGAKPSGKKLFRKADKCAVSEAPSFGWQWARGRSLGGSLHGRPVTRACIR